MTMKKKKNSPGQNGRLTIHGFELSRALVDHGKTQNHLGGQCWVNAADASPP